MGHGGHSLVLRGLYALQLLPWIAEFGVNNIKIMSIGAVKGDHTHRTMQEVFRFVGLPPTPLASTEAKNVREAKCPLDKANEDLLEEFYAPYNAKLFELIGRTIEDW